MAVRHEVSTGIKDGISVLKKTIADGKACMKPGDGF